MDAVLARHNEHRAKHHASPLVWDEGLAASAQAWADNCVFEHSGTAGAGENLAYGANLVGSVDMWYNEVSGCGLWCGMQSSNNTTCSGCETPALSNELSTRRL
jgi:uncharacterized protein YkwD